MSFPRIYGDETCPLEGYEGYTFRVLLNPTGREKNDWAFGNLGDPDCPNCTTGKVGRVYCASCLGLRDQFGRGAHVIYGTSRVDGFDFSSPDAAIRTFEGDMPDEFLAWLYMLPGTLWMRRAEDLKKRLSSPLMVSNGSS